ncbi:hypothetical protein [Nocardia sp. NPDC127526]|uniref:hypothetical protein n=1 Tax=Nocardia sp. NPDC127526 TaxID=3345393 RepID=UPI003627CB9D
MSHNISSRRFHAATLHPPRPAQVPTAAVQRVYPAGPIVALTAVVTSAGFVAGFLIGWQKREEWA